MKIVFVDSMTIGNDVDLSFLNELGEFVAYSSSTIEEARLRVKDADVVIANKVPMNESTLGEATNVKLIALTATGYNNVDFEYVNSRGIAVTNVAGYSTDSVVQHTFALLLHLGEQLEYYSNYVKSGEYLRSPMFCNLDRTFYELKGKTWGIIGLGEIGREVARLAQCFGCRVIYYSTSGRNANSDYTQVSLDELLAQSDIVTIHAPLNEATHHLMNYEAFCKMKPSSLMVNVGRGPIVDEAGLVKALKENRIAGAALDVIEKEPMQADCPLLEIIKDPRLIVTPHIAWGTLEARTRLMTEVKENIAAFVKGERRNRIV